MKSWKIPLFCLMIAICLMLNYGGMKLAESLSLPFWMDSLGIVLCAYMAGPLIGGLVGLTTNLIFYVVVGSGWEYAAVSIMIGVVAGIAARKKKMDNLFDTLTVGALIAILTLVIAVPLNLLINNGSTGNIWGDAVSGFFRERGLPHVMSLILGQLYVELLDKIVIMILAFLLIRLGRRTERKKEPDVSLGDDAEPVTMAQMSDETAETAAPAENTGAEKNTDGAGTGAAKALALLLAAGIAMGTAAQARAEETEKETETGLNINDYVQTIYDSTNGLPCGEANDIAQTADGVLWIGTYAGLYRYNGREFRWMDNLDSVRNVNALYVDEEGRLWIGTNDNGLSIMINEEITNVIDQTGGLPNNSVSAIIRSQDGYYYIGTKTSLQVLSLNYGLHNQGTLSEVKYAVSLSADEFGRVAAVTDSGTLYLLSKGQILSSRQLTGGNTAFRSCEFDSDGILLAGTTGNQIYSFDVRHDYFEETGTVRETGNLQNIKDMTRLADGELMITTDSGIGIFDPTDHFSMITTTGFNNSIDKVLTDFQGNMWFTSSRLGLLRLAPSDFRDLYGTLGMNRRVVNAMVRWNGGTGDFAAGTAIGNRDLYYIGTDNGLDAVDLGSKKQVMNNLTRQLTGGRVRCMIVDRNNHLWICDARKGVLEVEPDNTQYLYTTSNGATDNKPRVIIELSDGTIASGGDLGVTFIRDHQVVQAADESIRVLTLLELPDGRLLAGTDGNGILLMERNEENKAWQVTRTMTREDGLSSEVILRLTADPRIDGAAFIVSSNSLCYLDVNGSIRMLDKFPYFNNYDIWAKGKDTMFVLSSAGIYVADRGEMLANHTSNNYELLDARRGLTSSLTANAWTYYNENTGELFLPCDTGVFIIDTDHYSAGTRAYRLSVPSARLDGVSQRVERTIPIRLGRGSNKLELNPEIVNYTIQDPNVGYMLEGFDSDWTVVPAGNLSSITYTNLPTGNYTFRLAVFDNEQKNILTERRYQLVKDKELYDNAWFIAYLLTIPMFTVAWVTWLLVKRRNQRMERELAEANRHVEMGKQTVRAIARAVDAKDVRTGGHSTRVALYSGQMAKEYGMDEKQCREIEWAAQLHDIGKIAIPDAILNKDSRLTDTEYATMKTHTTQGAEILKDFTLLDHVAEGALYHHERPDGRGYPQGLKGEEVPLYARIIGVADAFDAMTANRVYRKQMDFGYVLGELEKGRGTQFDPVFVDILLKLIREGTIDLNKLYGIKPEDAGLSDVPAAAPGKEA